MYNFLLFILMMQAQVQICPNSAVHSAAEYVVSQLEADTKALLLETPPEWRYSVFDERLGRGIRNMFGLRGGVGADERLLGECDSLSPNIDSDMLAHECTAIILSAAAGLIRASVDNVLVASLDTQLHELRETELLERNYFTDRDYHLVEVVEELNDLLERDGRAFKVSIDPNVLARRIEVGGGQFWEPVLRQKPRFQAINVFDVLKRIKFELSTCIRRSPEEVWIGDDCSSFEGTIFAF